MLTLRPYQEEAVASVYEHLRTRDDNPCVMIPTGGGKTPVNPLSRRKVKLSRPHFPMMMLRFEF
jgi:superfamily II DNA or RNA helicase